MKKFYVREAKDSELEKGIGVEKEHTETYKKIKDYYEKNNKWPDEKRVYTWIASDHLKEHKDYYTKLLEMGL